MGFTETHLVHVYSRKDEDIAVMGMIGRFQAPKKSVLKKETPALEKVGWFNETISFYDVSGDKSYKVVFKPKK